MNVAKAKRRARRRRDIRNQVRWLSNEMYTAVFGPSRAKSIRMWAFKFAPGEVERILLDMRKEPTE